MITSTFFKFKHKTIVHAIVLVISIFSLYLTIEDAVNRNENLFQGGFYNAILFVFTVYIIALVIIPLLFENWKKHILIAVLFCFLYSFLLAWFRASMASDMETFKEMFSSAPIEHFNFEFMFRSFMTIIPMGVMGLFYFVFVTDWKKLKQGFFQKNTEITINVTLVVLIISYVLIMPIGSKTDELLFTSFLILFFYINTFYISPVLLISKKKSMYVFFGILWFVILNVIYFLILYFFSGPMGRSIVTSDVLSISFLIRIAVLVFIPIFIVSFIYGYIRIKIKNQDKNIVAQDSELKLLKSQVNPHFLFNTLNTLYSTALEEKAEKTAESTAKLANLIRYMQEDINKDFIPLQNEIKYLRDYITIQKLRCAIEPEIDSEYTGIGKHQISPGLLIPFVENAFKYGIDPSKPSKLSVSVVCDDKTINFKCINSYSEHFKTYYKEQGFGIGIKNAKQRLALVYPKKHTFEVVKENNVFSVNLSINI